jgi:tRNA nucleotidyltransferase (CCA-adding enzyme)
LDPPSGAQLIARLRAIPGAAELLELTGGSHGVHLVGGAVRDLLLGRTPRELDVLVEEQDGEFGERAALLAGDLASRLHALAGSNEHERFGTAIVQWEGGRIDIATARRERYPLAGELPEVAAAGIEEDLERRDFTVNAIALELGAAQRGRLRAVPDALEDLAARVLRVLHEQSFIDDPTRLLRLARYSTRLDFQVEDHTAQLASEALAAGALQGTSGARVGSELRLALGEADPPATLRTLQRLGVLRAIHPRLRVEERPLTDALELLGDDGDPGLLALSSLLVPLAIDAGPDRAAEARLLLDRLQFAAGERDRALAAALACIDLPERLAAIDRPSALRQALLGIPPEGVALAGALAPAPGASNAALWLRELRHVRLAITGDDLLGAGMAPGPEVGRRLEATLERLLDGQLPDDPQAQLKAALGV